MCFKCCLCFFPIPSTVTDLVCILNNFQSFLAFNLYIASLHTSLSAFTSLLKHWGFLSSRAFYVYCSFWSQYSQVVPDYFLTIFCFNSFSQCAGLISIVSVEKCSLYSIKYRYSFFLYFMLFA